MRANEIFEKHGDYVDEHGVSWSTLESYLQGSVLGFCCCGVPEYSLSIVYKALSLLNSYRKDEIDYDSFSNGCLKQFGSQEITYFIWYTIDEMGLTEHGGSVPGWMTEKGKELLLDLGDYFKDKKE